MIRMRKVLENERTIIFKIEGEIAENNQESWINFLKQLGAEKKRQQVLDFCDAFINCPKALAALVTSLNSQIFLLNCSSPVRNMLQSAGYSSQVLGC